MENYETLGVIGEGTYGVVMKARHRETGQLVAIKKFKESDEDEQVRKTSLREVRVLKQLKHDNVITLLEVFRRKGKLYLVFEYVEKTILEVLERRKNGLDENDVRRFMFQLLRGVEYCHAHNIIHRDIKPENILISKSGALKLCDFGFARTMSVGGKYTDYVATRWYRGPELLVGDVEYGKGVDIWAVGCIFAEISNGMPLFPGESDLDQLSHIMRCTGKLTTKQVQVFKRNPLFTNVELPAPRESETLDQRFPIANKAWLTFLKSCLRNDPDQRETAAGLLSLPYFVDRGFKQEFEAELRIMFEKENRLLAAFSSTRRPTATAEGAAPPDVASGGGVVLPPALGGAQPSQNTPPSAPALMSTTAGKGAQSWTNNGMGGGNGPSGQAGPNVGTLWSQYLASTSSGEQLPDLAHPAGAPSRGQTLLSQHPSLFAPPNPTPTTGAPGGAKVLTSGIQATPYGQLNGGNNTPGPGGLGLYYGQVPSTPSQPTHPGSLMGATSKPTAGVGGGGTYDILAGPPPHGGVGGVVYGGGFHGATHHHATHHVGGSSTSQPASMPFMMLGTGVHGGPLGGGVGGAGMPPTGLGRTGGGGALGGGGLSFPTLTGGHHTGPGGPSSLNSTLNGTGGGMSLPPAGAGGMTTNPAALGLSYKKKQPAKKNNVLSTLSITSLSGGGGTGGGGPTGGPIPYSAAGQFDLGGGGGGMPSTVAMPGIDSQGVRRNSKQW